MKHKRIPLDMSDYEDLVPIEQPPRRIAVAAFPDIVTRSLILGETTYKDGVSLGPSIRWPAFLQDGSVRPMGSPPLLAVDLY